MQLLEMIFEVSMTRISRLFWGFLLLFSLHLPAQVQDLAGSAWMEAFNNGDFETVIAELPAWLQNVEWDLQGIPLYFLAESYYNLAVAETNTQTAISHFKAALENFDDCTNHADMSVSDYRHTALYKKGWSQFRLAELGDSNPRRLYQDAYESFSQVEDQAPDNLSLYSLYMAGDARLRQAVLERYAIFSKDPDAAEVNADIGLLNDARRKLEQVINRQHALEDLKTAARIRVKDVYYQIAKIYQNVTTSIFQNINDQNKGGSPFEAMQFYISRADYLADVSILPADKREMIEPVLVYSDAMSLLNLYLLQPDNQLSLTLTNKIENIPDDPYAAEKLFRKGNRDQANQVLREGPFAQLSLNTGFYARAANNIPEAYYWFGFVKSVVLPDQALPEFNTFLQETEATSANLRQKVLKEDAELRKFSLDIERIMRLQNSGQKQRQLRSLEPQVEAFQPTIARIQKNKEQLLQRIGILLEISGPGNQNEKAGRIYRNILNQNPSVAEELIQELLPQAAATTGLSRAAYLDVLDILCLIISNSYPNKSNFYQGIVLSLKAEISDNQNEKIQLFQQSAEILQNITEKYRDEALYIRGRSLFFAKEYKDANAILKDLINRRNSLRALFYLGESFRVNSNGRAARRCYQVIKDRTQNAAGGTFWFNNADAAANIANNEGNENVLNDINISSVTFPDELLLDDDGNPISYEGLADSRYLQTQLAREGKELLMKFSLPKRTLYPSPIQIAKSQIVAEGVFPDVSAVPDERRGAITASLMLVLVTPPADDQSAYRVSFDGEIMPSNSEGVYTKDQIDLNDSVRVRIERPGYYPIIDTHTFQSPGVDSVFVVPTEHLTFSSQGKANAKEAVIFPDRLDNNIILNSVGDDLPKKSDLYQDFLANPTLRDYVFHPQLNTYLIVDAANNRIVRAPTPNTRVALADPFSLTFADPADALDSPEGITVDSDGLVYIADWGNHRVLIFEMSGTLLKAVGAFGANNSSGEDPKFMFPTRVTVAESNEGLTFNGRTVKPDKLLFVADRTGVHLIDARGTYWDTVLQVGDANFDAGSFYGIKASRQQNAITLQVADRQKQEILEYVAR